MKYSCIIALALIWMACGRSESDVLEPEEMKLVMWDMLRADEVGALEGLKDTVPNNLLRHATEKYGQVFAIHHITRQQFYNSYDYYKQHPEEHKLLMDSLLALANRVKEQRDKIKTAKSDSLQKAAHMADSLAARKDSAAGKTAVKDSLALKDSAATAAAAATSKAVPLPVKDTAKRLLPAMPRIDTSRRRLLFPKLQRDGKPLHPVGRRILKLPS